MIDFIVNLSYTFIMSMKSITTHQSMNGGRCMSMKKGQHIFGTVKVGEKGQIVIPKEARQIFDIKAGDTLLVLGDEEQGIAIVKADIMKELAVKILKGLGGLSSGIDYEE